MIKKINDYTYEIDTAGLGSKMFFHPWSRCGHIHNGIGLGLESMRGGWVIPLSEAWQMVLLATMKAAEHRVHLAPMGAPKVEEDLPEFGTGGWMSAR